MQKEMRITVNGRNIQIFMQDGFFHPTDKFQKIHRHQYSEIHLILRGLVEYRLGKNIFCLTAGDMLVIPPCSLHSCTSLESGSSRLAFQVDLPIPDPLVLHPGIPTITLLSDEISYYAEHGFSQRLEACLSLICCELPGCPACNPVTVHNREFLLEEYLSNNYHRDITLKDVADVLNLSEKQTARLIRKYKGTSFREALTGRRMEAADMLMEDPSLTLEEIASMVGYQSYSGFWKAYNKR